MTTIELIELLETCNPDAEVVISHDGDIGMVNDVEQIGNDLVTILINCSHEA